MRLLFFLSSIALALSFGLGLASRVIKEGGWPGAPDGWIRGERADPSALIRLIFAVKQRNLDVLESTLLRVSSPSSPDYGHHLSFDEVNDLVAPSPSSIEAVVSFLATSGVDVNTLGGTPNQDFITAVVSIQVAERLLDTKYYVYEHSKSGLKIVRVGEKYSLPASVAPHVDFVGPTIRFPGTLHPKVYYGEAPLATVTPDYLKTLYGVPSGEAGVAKNNSVCVTGFLGQYINTKDLQQFFTKYDPSSSGRSVTIIGPNDESQPGVEAQLDIEYVMAMGENIPTTFWSDAGRSDVINEPWLDWLQNVSASATVPWVISASYGDYEHTVTYDYGSRCNVEFQKNGLRGVSFFASSGDGGVAGAQSRNCDHFSAVWPAASPWVTAVGGTTSTVSNTETCASFSGGGFSDYWDRPDYQTAPVAQYFQVAKGLPASSYYNQTGAGFPDVGFQAEDFMIVISGTSEPVSGTSCSSPSLAGLFALLNDVRLQANKTTLGYLNPWIYSLAGNGWNDITTGSNPGCGTSGFPAAPGWDPVTGWGTPNYAKLKSLVQQLP